MDLKEERDYDTQGELRSREWSEVQGKQAGSGSGLEALSSREADACVVWR